jgi:hypothetical protein
MKRQTKLTGEQQQNTAEQQSQQQAAQEFANAEDLLRYDAAHTFVPPGISQRLQKSVGSTGPAKPKNVSWWQRIFRGEK